MVYDSYDPASMEKNTSSTPFLHLSLKSNEHLCLQSRFGLTKVQDYHVLDRSKNDSIYFDAGVAKSIQTTHILRTRTPKNSILNSLMKIHEN